MYIFSKIIRNSFCLPRSQLLSFAYGGELSLDVCRTRQWSICSQLAERVSSSKCALSCFDLVHLTLLSAVLAPVSESEACPPPSARSGQCAGGGYRPALSQQSQCRTVAVRAPLVGSFTALCLTLDSHQTALKCPSQRPRSTPSH